MVRKILSLMLVLSMMVVGFVFAEEETVEHQPFVILYVNDVHCGIDDAIGYAGLVAYEKAYEQAGYEVILADCGDAIQGAAVGTISNGEYIVDIMNEVGFDVATIGNHEFDYGMDRFMELKDKAEYAYVACNFTDLEGNTILDAYTIMEIGGYQVAFVGIETPETFAKSTPTFFQDEEGNFIYSFCGGNDGADLYAAVQKAVDDAKSEGAEIVIALAHLGTDYSSTPWMSTDVIANTTGIDVMLDGHSHSVIPGELVLNKDGEEVLLTSTGTKLEAVGALTVTTDGEVVTFSSQLHTEKLFQDAETADYINSIKDQYTELLNEVVAQSEVDLVTNDPTAVDENGAPLYIIRIQETNLANFCTDAYRAISGADIAFVNGGGIRAAIPAGNITYEDIIAVHPYGNMLTVVEATGQEILDALEMSARHLPDGNGGFQHVAGMTFEINVSIPSTVVVDENGMFVEITGDRRVQNAMVAGEPLDPEKTYSLASHNYMLKSSGDGFNMFADNVILQDEVMLDNQVLITYITDFLGGIVGEAYSNPYGEGRITIIE